MKHSRFAALGVAAMMTLAGGTALASGPSGASATGGASAAGGGGVAKASCTNALSVTATASEALTGNSFVATYVLAACQSRTRVSMTATDLTTGRVAWTSPPDVIGTVAVWTLPYSLTTYRIDARAVAGTTNTLVATASTNVATLDALPCDRMIVETPTTGYWLTYPAIWATHAALDCGIPGVSVRLRITNLTSGRVELDYGPLALSSTIDYEGAALSYSTPYQVDAELRDFSDAVVMTSTAYVTTGPRR